MSSPPVNRSLSVAPMMDRSDRPFRLMMRQITRHTLLYTEMITARALLAGRAGPYQSPVDPLEHPVSLQLGGDDPQALAQAALMAQELGYDEVNLNVGCPSDRVKVGRIGAVLMRDAPRVADCLAAMRAKVRIPVTVKHRLGVDEDPDEALDAFVDTVAQSGVRHFTVHARKAWLQGLSPKENRNIPPLRYELVHALAQRRPDLSIEINGGFQDLDACEAQLRKVQAVMIGRAAWDSPMLFAQADARFFASPGPEPSPNQIARSMIPYMEQSVAQGRAWSHALRPILNLFHGRPKARKWRRLLSEGAAKPTASSLAQLVEDSLRELEL